MAEAVIQARKGLDLLANLPDSLRRRQQELDLQLTLGMALMITNGYTATETVETLAIAQSLAEQLDQPEYFVPLMIARSRTYNARAEHRLALSFGQKIEEIGEDRNEPTVQFIGRVTQGISHLYLGELVPAHALLEAQADPAPIPVNYRYVPSHAHVRAMRLVHAGKTLALLGYIDQARLRVDEALSQAQITRNVHTLIQVLVNTCAVYCTIGSTMTQTEELLALATEGDFPQYFGWALAFRGRALIALGQAQEGFALLTQALAQLRTIGIAIALPDLLVRLADVSATLGRPADAWLYVAEAARIVEATDERVFEAEALYQVPGDLLYAAGDQVGAEQLYRQAIAIAERQSTKLLQLRASVSFARLRRDQGRRAEAYDLLAPMYGWFTSRAVTEASEGAAR